MTYTISNAARSTHGQDGAIVLDVEQGQMFSVNLVGSRILELLESGSTRTEIVTTISREFKADLSVVENDLHEFINSLKTHKLLTER
jgi:Coenzyme PQQ synthesis protein D (PqqD)